MRLEDLPAALREKVAAELGEVPRKRTTRAGDVLEGVEGSCACGEHFEGRGAWRRFERHSDATGHRRFVMVGD